MINKNKGLHQNSEIFEITNMIFCSKNRLKGLLLLPVFLGFFHAAFAVFSPQSGDTLTFRQVHFQWNPIWRADSYQLRMWESASEGLPPPLSAPDTLLYAASHNSVVVSEELAFGKSYLWQVHAYIGDSLVYTSVKRGFHIRTAPRMDPALFRHRVVADLLPAGDAGYFFIDKPGVAIDRKGAPVWFFPSDKVSRVFNLQLLPNGHIAYLRPAGKGEGNEDLLLEEITLRGDMVWRAPNDGQVSGHEHEYYHHDFQRLSNGHYMVLGNQYVSRQPKGAKGAITARYGTLIEYDTTGKAVWFWRSQDYLQDIDVFDAGLKDNPTHLNGFCFDEATGLIYVSFRYIDRIVQIAYSTRQVVNSFGRKMPSGEARSGDGLFFHQHSPRIAGNQLYLYDNRMGKGADTVSSVVVLKIPKDADSAIQVRDRYVLNFGSKRSSWSESKGDVDILPAGKVLACMGAIPRTVVWDEQQGLVWQVEHESRPDSETPWRGIEGNYRADWSADLYPLRFAVSAERQPGSKRKKGQPVRIQITNLGQTSDAYQIGLTTANGEYYPLTETGILVSKQASTLSLQLKKSRMQAAKGWRLRVSSRLDPALQATIEIPAE